VNSADDKATTVEPEFQAPPQVEPNEVEEVEQELDDFEAELELEEGDDEEDDEELVVPEPEPKPATSRKTAAKKTAPARKRTDDF